MNDLPNDMTAITVAGGSGPAEALVTMRLPVPSPRPGQILIRTAAAGINRPDILQRQGFYPPPPGAPPTLGLEVAGEVIIGSERWKAGDRVCALLPGGGYAEYALADEGQVLPVPDGMSLTQAAAIPETVFTVFANVFEDGALKRGETLLVHGATSGIGTTAIGMAKAAGASVFATVRGAEKKRIASELGADFVVDTTVDDFGAACAQRGGVDVVLDMVGGNYLAPNLAALKQGGRIVYIAALGGLEATLPVLALMVKRAVLTGSTLRSRSAEEKARLAREVQRIVWPWLETGKLRPKIDATYPLDRAAEAHAHMEAGGHVGKIVLLVDAQ